MIMGDIGLQMIMNGHKKELFQKVFIGLWKHQVVGFLAQKSPQHIKPLFKVQEGALVQALFKVREIPSHRN
jgi:hypothetical protein